MANSLPPGSRGVDLFDIGSHEPLLDKNGKQRRNVNGDKCYKVIWMITDCGGRY